MRYASINIVNGPHKVTDLAQLIVSLRACILRYFVLCHGLCDYLSSNGVHFRLYGVRIVIVLQFPAKTLDEQPSDIVIEETVFAGIHLHPIRGSAHQVVKLRSCRPRGRTTTEAGSFSYHREVRG